MKERKRIIWYLPENEYQQVKTTGWQGLVSLYARGEIYFPPKFHFSRTKHFRNQIIFENANGADLVIRSEKKEKI